MTVTLNLDPTLIARAEAQAAREGRTVDEFVQNALALFLDSDVPTADDRAGQHADVPDDSADWRYEDRDGRQLPFPVFDGGTGLAPGVDGRSNKSLLAAADAADDARVLHSLGHDMSAVDA